MAYVRQHPDPKFSMYRMKVGVMPDFSGANFISQEVPEGDMDGVNRNFKLAHRVLKDSEEVFKDGMRMRRSSNTSFTDGDYFIDYSSTPTTIIFSDKQVPQPKSTLLVSYKYLP